MASSRSPGFTLIEILIVLVILAIVSTIGVLSLSYFDHKQKAKNTGEQLQRLIHFAEQVAVLQQNKLSLEVDDAHYQFFSYNQNQWQAIHSGPLSHAYSVPRNLQISTSRQDHRSDKRIIFYPSWQVTPFSIVFSLDGGEDLSRLHVKRNGEVSLHAFN